MADVTGVTLLPSAWSRPGSFRVSVLGPLVAESPRGSIHVSGAHRRCLLALMASQPGHVVRVDTIVDTLWGDDPPPTAVKTVQSHVLRLRRSLRDAGGQVIETAPGGYRLAVDRSAVDAGRFEQLVADARELMREGDLLAAVDRFVEALALWRGPAYVEFRQTDFGMAEGVRLDELCLAAREEFAEAQIASGSASAAVVGLESLVHDSPGREGAWQLLMSALYASGRQHDALGAFQRARRGLADFGLEPGAQLSDMERRILEHDPALAPVSGTATLAAALRTSGAMIGRDAERRALITAWQAAKSGFGQFRVLSGPLESGRTRLAIDLAGRALADGAAVEYARGTEILSVVGWARTASTNREFGRAVDVLAERCRSKPLLLIVDDVEWANSEAIDLVRTVAAMADQLALLLLVVIDRSGGGPVVTAIDQLDPTGSSTIDVEAMPSEELATVISAEGVDPNAVAGIIAVSNGLPGVAKRESAAWAERTASERLRIAAASSLGANALAQRAQASVLDEVVELVAARARRDELWSARWAGRQPYRALATYGPQDAELFVGRERLVAELAARVLERRLVVVVGCSGSGKSSLVRAGLIPLARSGRLPGAGAWATHIIVPGFDPLAALAVIEELDEQGARLLVVDQFEEAFAAPAATLDRFCSQLLDLAGDPDLDVHVVLVIRSDEYTKLASIQALTDVVTSSQLMVGPPSDDEVRRIVTEPARRTGVAVEPALVDLVSHDVGGYEAALPLVSAALSEVWERRDGNLLRAERYIEIGGVATAVERLGEQAVVRAGESHIGEIRRILLMLADVTDDGFWTRRRVPIEELPADPSALAALVDARLVVRNDQTVEITHEVVFRTWPRLARWLELARTDLVLERDLRAAARSWDTDGRTDDNLYRGARLHAALEWLADNPSDLKPHEREFVTGSRDASQSEATKARRTNRRLRSLLAAVAVLLVAAVAGASLAVIQRGEARDAETAQLAQRLGAQALTENYLDISLLLARQAVAIEDTPQTRSALLAALARAPTALGIMHVGNHGRLDSAALSPDGRTLAVLDFYNKIVFFDALTYARIGEPLFAPEFLRSLAYSPDGATLAYAGQSDGGSFVRLIDPRTRRQLAEFRLSDEPWNIAFTNDGTHVIIGGRKSVSVHDAVTLERVGDPIQLPDVHEPTHFSLTPDGRAVITVSDAGELTWWDMLTGQPIRTLDVASGHGVLALRPDGRSVAVGIDHGVQLIDVDSGAVTVTTGLLESPNLLRFSPDGGTLVSANGDGTMTLLDAESGSRRGTLHGHADAVRQLVFTHDSGTLYTVSADGATIAWDLTETRSFRRSFAFTGDRDGESPRVPGQFSPDGELIAVGLVDEGIALWDADRLTQIGAPLMETGGTVDELAFSPDGGTLAALTRLGNLTVWDVATRSLRYEPIGTRGPVLLAGVAFGADGTILVATADNGIRLFDAATGASLGGFASGQASDLSLSADGTLAAFAGANGAEVWDVAARERVLALEGDADAGEFSVALSPDGRTLAVGGWGRFVRHWDVGTGQLVHTLDVGADDSLEVLLEFSPDGRYLATNETIWDAETGVRFAPILTVGLPTSLMDLSSDGHRLLVTTDDGRGFIWNLDPASWPEPACALANRALTRDEWETFLPGLPYEPACLP
jgi:WD40 repeat protein/DNA-binding SARP family transcriptional activator